MYKITKFGSDNKIWVEQGSTQNCDVLTSNLTLRTV